MIKGGVMDYKGLRTAFSYVTLVALVLFVASAVKAADSATVTATVTAQNISVTVSDGTVTYGTIGLSSTRDTTTGGVDDSQTANNNGNITEDFNIKGQNTAAWTLAGSVGADAYFHKFCTATCDASPTWIATTTSYQTLATGVASAGDQIFDTQVGTPSSTSSYTEQSVDIIVQAVAN